MKLQLLVLSLLMSCGLCCMDDKEDEGNKINLLKAINYVNQSKEQNEIVICRLDLKNPEGHITARSNWQEYQPHDTQALGKQMQDILEQSVSKFSGEDLKKPQFIVYSILPSMEKDLDHPSSIKVFKEDKKSFIIVIRKDGEDVLVKSLKRYYPDDTLVFFPRKEKQNSRFFLFCIPVALFVGFVCYFKWWR